MNSKRFIILTVSLLTIAAAAKLVQACGTMYNPNEDLSFFLTSINDHKDYQPFHYTSYSSFFADNDESGDQNTLAWMAYAHDEVSEGDIGQFVYQFAAKDVANLYGHLKNGDPLSASDTFRNNGFTKWLIKNKDVNATRYLVFAKTCEPYTAGVEAIWNDKTYQYEPGKVDSVEMQKLVNEGISRCNKTKNDQLKLRYAYQVLRMSFYSRTYKQTVNLFDQLVHPKKRNVIYYRCISLKAGALYRLHRKNEAAYFYSVVFDNTQEKRQMLNTSFGWSSPSNMDSVLAFCKNDHERAAACIMYGLYGNQNVGEEITYFLKEAYAYDPHVQALEILMTHAINYMERQQVENMATSKTADPDLDTLSAFCVQVAEEGKNPHPAYWYISAAYIDVWNGNAERCKKHLDLASGRKMTDQEREVHALVNVLRVTRKYGDITPATEAELLPLLKKLETAAKGVDESSGYGNIFYNMMITVIGAKYKAQGDFIKNLYCESKTGSVSGDHSGDELESVFGGSPGEELNGISGDDLHAVQQFILKKNKTPFEKWLTDKTPYTIGNLRELEGTRYIQQYKFDSAVLILQRVPDSVLGKITLPDVLVSHIIDNQLTDESDNNQSYDKLTFAKKMVELRQKLEMNPKDSRAAYQYANAMYNISYYGKAHRAYEYYRNSSDDKAYCVGQRKTEEDYYSVATSLKYYLIAFENSKDKEVKARCLFMAAKCWQKNCPGNFSSWDDNILKEYYNNTFKNPYLARLKNEYRNTKFFNTATGSCSYFRDYVKKR